MSTPGWRKSPLIRHVRRKGKRPPPERVAERQRPKAFLHFRKTIPILPNGVTGRFDLYNHANLFVVWVFPVVEEQFNPDCTMHLSAEKSAEKTRTTAFFLRQSLVSLKQKSKWQPNVYPYTLLQTARKLPLSVMTERLPVHPTTNRKEVITFNLTFSTSNLPNKIPEVKSF